MAVRAANRVCIYIYTHIHTHTHTYTHMYVHTHTHMLRVHVYISIFVSMYVYTHTYMHIYIYIYIIIYIYIYIVCPSFEIRVDLLLDSGFAHAFAYKDKDAGIVDHLADVPLQPNSPPDYVSAQISCQRQR